ncbi:TetR/AcrR family transcriptional regulator [Bradyrhizobium liaoningense]|uniref:TetR/AcrR family transcriptional regulator n=1 Tax=Bradyrhizobium liaoningense TaxID=43992 RepID=UPI001BAD444C|nr:TetR family transcriptional regulator [Bradyrhizobium liaoningense]
MLAAALGEFARNGLDGARVDRIAQRAGVNKQALYYHFGSKKELFRATLASAYSNTMPVERFWVAPDLPPELAMRALIASLFEFFRRLEDEMAIIAHENRHRGKHLTPKIQEQIRGSVSPIIQTVREILARGQREGVFSCEANAVDLYVTLVAEIMFYFSHAYTLSAIVERDLLSEKAVEYWKTHVADFVLAALRPSRTKRSDS